MRYQFHLVAVALLTVLSTITTVETAARNNRNKLTRELRQALRSLSSSEAIVTHRKGAIKPEIYAAMFAAYGTEWRIADSTELERVRLGCVSDYGDYTRLLDLAVITDTLCLFVYQHGGVTRGRDINLVWYKGETKVLRHSAFGIGTDAEAALNTLAAANGWSEVKEETDKCKEYIKTTERAVLDAEVIFIGKVSAIRPSIDALHRYNFGPAIENVFVVEEVFKGTISEDTVVVFTGLENKWCNKSLRIGEKYIMYAEKGFAVHAGDDAPLDLLWRLGSRTRVATDKVEIAMLRAYAEKRKAAKQ